APSASPSSCLVMVSHAPDGLEPGAVARCRSSLVALAASPCHADRAGSTAAAHPSPAAMTAGSTGPSSGAPGASFARPRLSLLRSGPGRFCRSATDLPNVSSADRRASLIGGSARLASARAVDMAALDQYLSGRAVAERNANTAPASVTGYLRGLSS